MGLVLCCRQPTGTADAVEEFNGVPEQTENKRKGRFDYVERQFGYSAQAKGADPGDRGGSLACGSADSVQVGKRGFT